MEAENNMKTIKLIIPMSLVIFLSACGKSSEQRVQDVAQIQRGEILYAENCSSCHGTFGQGAFNWRKPGPDGKYKPPPLNGTGHAWHHPKQTLRYVIMNGSPGGKGNMPSWKDKLTSEQIDDVIAWFQSKWDDKVYNAWYKRDQSSKR
jgi:mono/diheme cytochrome c family protein